MPIFDCRINRQSKIVIGPSRLDWTSRVGTTTFLSVAAQLGREEVRVANSYKPGPGNSGTLSHLFAGFLPTVGHPSATNLRSVPAFVSYFPSEAEHQILVSRSFQSRTGDFHPTTNTPVPGVHKSLNRSGGWAQNLTSTSLTAARLAWDVRRTISEIRGQVHECV